jgi:2-polyprenyl-3-methyl-5-hydroxy-6-metoxy-1,4-benzoquinol methylase
MNDNSEVILNKSMDSSLLDFVGFGARSDLENKAWESLLGHLEQDQADFLKHQDQFRSSGYKWPRDPLHTWSRLWEYPYVYHQIQRVLSSRPGDQVRVLDFGSGVTFFPFSVARLGCMVTCADIDPVCATDIPTAAKYIEHPPGSVEVGLIRNGRIPIESASQDVVYCISVLEHIPDFESAIDEIVRVLKPNGRLILTVDIDLRGNSELGVSQFQRMNTKLYAFLIKNLSERPVHPADLLTTKNSPFSMQDWSLRFALRRLLGGLLRGRVNIVKPSDLPYLAVYATVCSKGIE